MGDPAVANVPVVECGEQLVSAGEAFVMSPLKAAEEPYRSRVRQGLRDRLVAAQEHLPDGYQLCWVEGHRAYALQEEYFNDYRRRLSANDSSLTAEALYLRASRYVSPPRIAPHVSGAAI